MADKKLGVAVLTTSGRWPETGFGTMNDDEKVRRVLDEAAKKLKIKDTTGWVATEGGTTKEVNQDLSFKDNGLTTGDVVIDFGPSHGGGGARRA
jgi:hypothetical protein